MANSTYFKGKNAQGSRDLFVNRSLYRAFAYSPAKLEIFNRLDPSETYPLRNFYVFENFYYGRVDPFLYAVQPVKGRLVNIAAPDESTTSQFVFDFVADAWSDMRSEIKAANLKNILPTDNSSIEAMEPKKTFIDINQGYNSYLQKVQDQWFKFIGADGQKDLNEKIVSFETFLPAFTGFLKQIATERTLSKSAFALSSFWGSCNNSGLVIEIADFDKSDDQTKFDFINSEAFCYYVKLASKYGFFVDYNAPWRLIADISSPPMLKYRSPYISSGSISLFFRTYYTHMYAEELRIIRNLYFKTYALFVQEEPWFIKNGWVGDCRYSQQIYRVPLDFSTFLIKYEAGFWMDKYVRIKNWEKRQLIQKPRLEQIIKTSQNLVKTVDNLTAIRYINRKFRESIAAAEGSFNASLYASRYKNQVNLPFSNFKKFLNELYDFNTGNF